MSNLSVCGIAYQALPQSLFGSRQDIKKGFQSISKTLVKQVDQLLLDADISQQEIERHFLCSTMIELPFTTGAIKWQTVAKMLNDHGAHQPSTFVNAYECASWGYSLRHYLTQGGSKYLLVSILDANFYEFEFWRYNQHWENSGFGIATILLQIEGELTDELLVGATTTHNSMAEFATIVRRIAAKKNDVTLSMPFFPLNIREMFIKLLAGQPQLPDLHDDWGHCFGSDPWLSLLHYGLNNKLQTNKNFMVCSYALNGYYAIANVKMTSKTQLTLKTEWIND
jgi:hypothetical protein